MDEFIFISCGISIASIISLCILKTVNIYIISKKIKDIRKVYVLIILGLFALINLIVFIGVGLYFDDFETLNNIQNFMVVFFIGIGLSYQFTSVILFGDKVLLKAEYEKVEEKVEKDYIEFLEKVYNQYSAAFFFVIGSIYILYFGSKIDLNVRYIIYILFVMLGECSILIKTMFYIKKRLVSDMNENINGKINFEFIMKLVCWGLGLILLGNTIPEELYMKGEYLLVFIIVVIIYYIMINKMHKEALKKSLISIKKTENDINNIKDSKGKNYLKLDYGNAKYYKGILHNILKDEENKNDQYKKIAGKFIVYSNKFNIRISLIITLVCMIFMTQIEQNEIIAAFVIIFILIRCMSRAIEIITSFTKDVISEKKKTTDLKNSQRLKLALTSFLETNIMFTTLYLLASKSNWTSYKFIESFWDAFKFSFGNSFLIGFNSELFTFEVMLQFITSAVLIWLTISSYLSDEDKSISMLEEHQD